MLDVGGLAALPPLFVACLVSALVPLVNAELVVVGVAAVSGPHWAPAIALVGALGQVTGKIALYLGGRAGRNVVESGREAALSRLVRRLDGRPGPLVGTLLVSAVTGLPPFLLMSIAVGVLRMPLPVFLLVGAGGRFVRFYLLARLPGVV